jgi:prepilin-type N-terminal cleavage/methylation domain-containing protein
MKLTGSSKGLTLIELILAIVVIGICGSGLFAAFSTILAQNKVQPYDITAGEALVREGLERILADKRNTNGGFGFSRIIAANYPAENLAGGYTRTTTISTWPGNTDLNNFRQVSVMVTKGGRLLGQTTCLVVNY